MAEKKNKQLLVEGNDDCHVVWALCEKYQLPESFEVIDCKGIEDLLSSVSVRLKQSGIDTIGLVVDADTNLDSRWQSIRSILQGEGYVTVPEKIPERGLIYREEGKVTVGVWLMPNNDTNGMLEDFIRFLVPEPDALMPIVTSVLDDLEGKNLNKYKSIHRSKALIHTWLSWQEDPGTPMGLSITKKYLDASVPECSVFVEWLRKLFEVEKESE